jgi:endonuclease-3
MAAPNRTALIAKAHKVLKQHYDVVKPDLERPLLQHMLFACALENASPAAAEKVYARLTHHFFDWNEVRVSTVTELAEVMKDLPEPAAAASNLKKILQGVFESTYSFDLEQLKKQNISAGIKRLQSLDGVTPFILAYTVQVALEGHSIPLDRGSLDVLGILGIASPAEVESGNVTGLERAIPKNKGVEFGSLLHQLGADYVASPHSPNVKKIITSINSQAVIPKRSAKQEPAKPQERKTDARSAKEKAASNGDHKVGAKSKPETAPSKTPEATPAKAEKPLAKPEKSPEKPAKRIEQPKKSLLPVKKKPPGKQLAKRKPR